MNNANRINIPITTPVVRYPISPLEILIRGYFATDNKVYVIRNVQAGIMQVELRRVDFHLKGFWRVVFAISLIGPLVCLLALSLNYQERCRFRYRLVREPKPRLVSPKRVRQVDFNLMNIVTESVQRSSKAQIPLAPRLYIKNIAVALKQFIENSTERTSYYPKLKILQLDKELILFEVLEALKAPGAEQIYKVLSDSFDSEFKEIVSSKYQLQLCHKIISSIEKGPKWLAQMDRAFCELLALLPEDIKSLRESEEFKELQKVVKQIAIDATQEVLFTPHLVKLKAVYDPVAPLLSLEPMEIDNFIENDEILARAS